MNAKKVIPLVISLLCAGLVLVAMKFYGHQATALLPAKGLQVVVAKTNVDAGSVLTLENLMVGEIAGQKAPDISFTDPSQLVGRVVSVPLVQGQVVTSSLLSPKGTIPGLPALVPDGMRAITLDINEITGVAGYITPGCRVDILQTVHPDPKSADSMTRTIAQNVKVLACGMKHGPEQDGGGRSITVLVTPEQAELFELAAMTGRSRMALRGNTDLARTDIKAVSLVDLSGKAGTAHDPLIPTPVVMNPITSQMTRLASPTTQPTQTFDSDSIWTMHVVNGGQQSDVKFKLPKDNGEDSDVRVSPEPIFNK